MKLKDILLSVVVLMLWITTTAISKPAILEVPPNFFLVLRFAFISLLFIPFFSKWPKTSLLTMVTLGTLFGITHGINYIALTTLELGTLSVITKTNVIFSVILSYLFLQEKISIQKMVGIGIALLGVTLVVGAPQNITNIPAVLLLLLGQVFFAIFNVLMKKVALETAKTVAWMNLFSVPPLIILSLILEENQIASLMNASDYVYFAIVYNVFAQAAAHYMYIHLIKIYDVSTVAPIGLGLPPLGVILGNLYLDEPLTGIIVFGCVVTVLGLLLVIRPELFRIKASR